MKNFLKNLTSGFILILFCCISCTDNDEIISENDCLPDPSFYVTTDLCRGLFNQSFGIMINDYGYSYCGNWIYDGQYNVYLVKDGVDLAYFGTAWIYDGDLTQYFNFSVPSTYSIASKASQVYKFQLRRISDQHTVNLPVGVLDCTVITNPASTSSVIELSPTTVTWNQNYFTSNVTLLLKKASDNSTVSTIVTGTSNNGSYIGQLSGLNQNTTCYITISDGTYSYNSASFTYIDNPLDCNGTNSVCAVYSSESNNFSDLVERNIFHVGWDETAISSSSVSIYLKNGSTIIDSVIGTANDGLFNEYGLNFPTVSENTSGFYVQVVGGAVTLNSQTFTVEND